MRISDWSSDVCSSDLTDSLWIFELTTPEGRVKKCILRAVGAGQQMRGINIDNQRPDMAVVDDVEDNENTESELLQKKLDRWISGPFLKALARRKKVIRSEERRVGKEGVRRGRY